MTTETDTDALFELRGVTKTYDQGATPVHAVRDVHLRIEPGEFVAVVGPSGSGKSTLLQLLGGIDKPTSGEIFLEGQNLGKLRDGELTALRLGTIGFVFQQFNLIPTVTAEVNIELALAPRGRSTAERKAIVDKLLDSVGLASRGHHLPSELSGGEQQRVAIARALANEPRVLLADEPTGNLDSTTGNEIVSLLRSLSTESGHTVVLITHDAAIASNAERTIRMQDGAVIEPATERQYAAA